MTSGMHRLRYLPAALVAFGLCLKGTLAQPSGGGGQLPPPVFEPSLVFTVNAGFPYGLASADILDANGDPGQDGYPEIAVAGMGVNWFDPYRWCGDEPASHHIKIYHNKGAVVAWDGTTPHDALELVQSISISLAAPGLWATELAFGDLTGDGHPDLVLVGMDPDDTESNLGRLLLFESLGTGLFDPSPREDIPTSVPLRGLAVLDMDLDGDLDVIAAANGIPAEWECSQASQDLVVKFKNLTYDNGGVFGFLKLPEADHAGAIPGDIATGDFYAYASGTPLTDLVTPNPGSGAVSAVANLGNMSIAPHIIDPPTGCLWPYATLTAAKFGADNFWDFAAVDNNSLTLDVFAGDGDGEFVSRCASGPYPLYPTGTDFLYAHGVESGSIDNGPYPDLAVALGVHAKGFGAQPDWYGAVAVLLGKGNGSFQPYSSQRAYLLVADDISNPNQPLAYGSINVLVVDLDADGFDDLVVANHLVDDGDNSDTISVLINALEVIGGSP